MTSVNPCRDFPIYYEFTMTLHIALMGYPTSVGTSFYSEENSVLVYTYMFVKITGQFESQWGESNRNQALEKIIYITIYCSSNTLSYQKK